MITKLNPNVIQDGSITAEKLADGIANDIISSLSTQSTLPSLTDYYIGQNAGGHTETYFKKKLESIGSVFQHELYDKVYLKDGSDPTFGNITAWQLNLSENSYVTHADGFGLALSVNDCAFLVGEEGGVYYLDDAGNTQTMLHSGNIDNYKLSQFTDDVVAGKYLPLSGGILTYNVWCDGDQNCTGFFGKNIKFADTTGWAREILRLDVDNKTKFSIGGYGQYTPGASDNESNGYVYIGCNDYNGANLRLTPSSIQWGGYNLIHAGNIGNYKSGDSANLGGYDISRFLLTTKRDYTTMDLNTIGDKQSIFTEIHTGEVTTSNCPISGYGALLSLKDGNSYAKMQIVSASGSADTYIRCVQNSGSTISANWQRILTDNNISSYALPLDGGELCAGANISWGHSNTESWASTAKGVRTLYSAGTMNGGSPSNYSAGLHIAGDSNFAFQMAYNPASAYVLKYRGFDANSAAWNDWKQIALTSDIPTKLSQLTDDVVAGKYLPLSGGTLSNALWRSQLTIERSGSTNDSVIAFNNSKGLLGCLGYRGEDAVPCVWLGETGTGTPIIHSGNIGNYEAGSSVWSKGLDRITSIPESGHCVYFYSGQPTLGDDINNAKEGSNAYHLWSYPVSGTSVSGGTANIMNLRLQWNTAYLHDIFVSPNLDDIWHRSIINYECNPWRKFAFTDSNVASATKLQTPRTLWGQSFDGSANIGGDITLNTYQDGRQLSIQQSGEIKFSTPRDNGWATSLSIYANDKTTLLTSAFGVHGIGEDVLYEFIGGTYDRPNVVVQDDTGYVGIGTANPSEKLDVAGNVKASGNITCSNLITTSTIVQTDNNSFIVHNAVSNGGHKMWITDGTGKSISAGNAFNLDAINIISDKSLVLGAQLDYNIRVLKANNRIAKVIDSVNYSTLLPYKTPVAISNTYSSDPHNIAMADNTLYIVNENEDGDLGCTILSFPTNDGSTPLTCGLLYTTRADSTGEFSCPTVIWSYNITPLMEPEATFEMWFTSYDGGTTWYGTHTVYK